MSDDALLTLKQLAEVLGLPESTVRYYRDAFLDQIPSVGSGRRRRYPPQAVAVLRSIAASYGAGRSRAEIVAGIEHHGGSTAVAVPAGQEPPPRAMEDVTNLDLLAAILDGEREQRDALWQMAKEIVRLTEVLEGQDKVLIEIADRAGVTTPARLGGGRPAASAALAAGPSAPAERPVAAGASAAPPPAATPPAAAPAPTPAAASPTPEPLGTEAPRPLYAAPVGLGAAAGSATPATAPAPAPAAPKAEAGSMAALRAELEAERQLVERLREAKLQLEHRAAGAEAELEERGRRSSVIRRLLGTEHE